MGDDVGDVAVDDGAPATFSREAMLDQEAVDALLALLDLEAIEVDLFRGVSPDERQQRVFGGQVAAQALMAANRSVGPDDGSVHSLHAYFLRPGDPSVPILYEVDRIRDGRSFTTRRVVAIQHGKAIFNLQCSFQVHEDGFDHQMPQPAAAPDPLSLPTFRERFAPAARRMGERYLTPRPLDVRHAGPAITDRSAQPPRQQVWFRVAGSLPDDPALHACVVTYASDMTLIDTAMQPHLPRIGPDDLMVASLDHAMWFHRPVRADQWLLHDQDSPSSSGGRGMSRGQIRTADGTLVVSTVQEGLIRPVRAD